jgi:aryl-alcohol dehydrogenase-like predicted oxidoreductase
LWRKKSSRSYTDGCELAIVKYVDLAKKYNIALSTLPNAFAINRPFVKSNIIGATAKKHLEEKFNSVDVTLTEGMLEDIHLSDPNSCVQINFFK